MGRGRQLFLTVGVALILISIMIGCAAEKPADTPTPDSTRTPKLTVTNWPTVTSTVFVTATPRPITYPEFATIFPSITPEAIATQLAGWETICPPEHPIDQKALALLIEPTGQYGFAYGGGFLTILSEKQISDLLNQYGPMSLISYLNYNYNKYFFYPAIQFLDLTGDGINELILQWAKTYIYSCRDDQYVLLGSFDMNAQQRNAEIIDARDENKNGYLELLILLNTMSQGGRWYGVFEYNGDEIVSVITPKLGGIWLEATGDINYRDIDGNGVSEIVAYLGLPVSDPYPGMPWRKEWDTYAWNGEFYVIVNTEFSAPEYRFQAAYDGDQSALSGKYKKALAFYQDVIFSDKLKWWTAERHSYESDLFYWDPPDSKPIMPDPDPNEYVNLAAYARYRIMLLYLLQRWDSDAQVVYNTLQEKYPEGNPGAIYAELAKIFWDEYQASNDMGHSCSQVIEVVEANQTEVFKYLGIDGNMGMFLPKYTPRDICPFE